MQCDFVQVVAKDGVNLEGLVFKPKGGPSTPSSRSGQTPTVVGVWIHGLGSNFHRNHKRTTTLAKTFNDAGLAFATFDTRGHDWVAYAAKNDKRQAKGHKPVTIGSAYEKFEECVLDLDAIVEFLRAKFKNVVLLGHSTGANKVVYYLSKAKTSSAYLARGATTQKKVSGAILISPVSDVALWKKDLGKNYEKALDVARRMIKSGKGKELMPLELTQSIYPARRFLSLASQKSVEQMFPTRKFRGPLRLFSKITIPTFIVFGEKDDYLLRDRVSAEVQLAVFSKYSKSERFGTEVISGADHGFSDHAEELGKALLGWIRGLV